MGIGSICGSLADGGRGLTSAEGTHRSRWTDPARSRDLAFTLESVPRSVPFWCLSRRLVAVFAMVHS